jgi:hypothetical protein
MKACGDKDGIWALLESGLQCEPVPSASSVYLNPFLSISAIVSHRRWIYDVHSRNGKRWRAEASH